MNRQGREGMDEDEIGRIVVNEAIKVHKALGPGLLESSYEACLAFELAESELKVERQKPLPLVYKGVFLDCGYRIDLLAEGKVIVEIKTVELLTNVHLAQMITYLKLSQCKLGFLINFNVRLLKEGIKRVVNKF